ncbi:MAG: hypothetical protein WAU49_21040 [Steroidobacteraceae bacterium]
MVRGRPKQRKEGALCKRSLPRAAPLDEIILHLQHVHSAVLVAIAALRRQNCELDEDIASLLQRCVCDRIDDQLQKLETARSRRTTRMRGV